MVDIFTKYTVVIPIKSRSIPEVNDAIEKAITKMGKKPMTIYSDNEGAFVSNEMKRYFEEKGIRHLTTLGHAPVAERQIKTIKHMVYQTIEKTGQTWHEVLFPVLLTYNNKMEHSTIKMTPKEAMKPVNQFTAKLNLELKRINSITHPNTNVGDFVKVYKKKTN